MIHGCRVTGYRVQSAPALDVGRERSSTYAPCPTPGRVSYSRQKSGQVGKWVSGEGGHDEREIGVNKQELVEALAKRLTTTKANAAAIVDHIFGTSGLIGQELRKGNKVQITGFGNFEARRRAPRRRWKD